MSDHLAPFKPERIQVATLDEKLVALCAFGEPTLHRMKKGWWCTIDMHVAAAGTAFSIKSESDCPSPTEAVDQCAERIAATLANLLAVK